MRDTAPHVTTPRATPSHDAAASGAGDLGFLVRWGVLVVLLVLGGLLLSAAAADDYTAVFGMLLTGFGTLIGFRIVGRMVP